MNVELQKPLTAEQAREALSNARGIVVVDDPENSKYPMPLFAAGQDPVYVGRIRRDTSAPNCIDMWVVADNIRKGAALNAVQIAQEMINRGLVKSK